MGVEIKMKYLLVVSSLLLLAACGSFTSVTQTEEGTFLQLIGNRSGVVLVIDDKSQLNLEADTKSFDLNGKIATKIVVSPGQHRIKIKRGGSLLVDRSIYVSEGNVFEVMIP